MVMKISLLAARYAKTVNTPVIRNAGFFLLLSAALGACSQASEQDLLERARTAFDEGNARAAEIDTRTALQRAPGNAAGRRLLGEVYLFQQNPVAAVDEFQRSLQAAEDDEVRVLYAQAMLGANRGEQLLRLDGQGEFASVRENPRYLALLASAQLNGGRLQDATDSIAAAMAAAPDDALVATINALFLLVHSNRPEDARATLQRVVAQHPDYADAWGMLGATQQMGGEHAEAETSFERAIQLNPNRFADRLSLITVRIDQGKTEEAQQALQRLLSSNPNHPGLNFLQGRMLVAAGENTEGLTALSTVLSADPSHAGALYLSAVANIAEGNLATARDQLDRLLAIQRGHVGGHLLLSNLHLRMGDPSASVQVARSILQDNPMNYEAMGILATALNAQNLANNVDEIIGLFRRMVETRPDAVEPRLALGAALLQTGDEAGGIAQFEAARDLQPESGQAQEALVQAQLARGDLPAARAVAAAYAESQAQNPRPRIYLARIALQQNDVPGANTHFAEAESLLRQALVQQPEDMVAQSLLIDTLVSQNKLDEADTMLAGLPPELAGNPAVQVARGRIALASNRPAEAEPLLHAALEQNPNTLTLLWLGGALKSQGRETEAINLLNGWLTNNPADVLVHFELASTYMQAGQETAALQHYQTVVDSEHVNVIALNNLAWLQRGNNPGQALVYAERANELVPNNPQVLDTYAMVQLELGRTGEALSLNQQALQLLPDDAGLRLHWAMILRADGQRDEAVQVLQGLVDADGIAAEQKAEAQTLLAELQGP